MADSKRDPRREPVVGDMVLSDDRRVRRTVAKVWRRTVTYNDGTELKTIDIESWKHWCRTRKAKVAKRAQSSG
jgi:hypothetical protein